MGMAELIFIIIVVVGLWFIFGRASSNKSKTQMWESEAVQSQIDWDAIQDSEVQQDMQANRKIAAIKRYRELTGCGLKEGKDAVEYAMEHGIPKRGKTHHLLSEMSDAGIRDLIAEGKMDEAVRVYQKFAGIDQFSAQEVVEQIQREMRLTDPSDTGSTLDSESDSFDQKLSRGS